MKEPKIENIGNGVIRVTHEHFYIDYTKIRDVWYWEDNSWALGKHWSHTVSAASIKLLEDWEQVNSQIVSLY